MLPSFLVMSWMSAAYAQDRELPLSAQLYRPPVSAPWTLWAEDARARPDRYFAARLVGVWTENPFVAEVDDETTVILVGRVQEVGLVAGMSFDRFQLGVHLPTYLRADGQDADGQPALGDVAVDGRLHLLGGQAQDPAGLAISGRVWAPTSTSPLALGHDGVAWEAVVAADLQASPVLFMVNLGYRGVPEVPLGAWTWGDAIVGRAGLASVGYTGFGVSAEMALQQVLPGSSEVGDTAVEGLLGTWVRLGRSDMVLHLGGGAGMTQGIGASRFRIIASLGYEPPLRRDADGDGLDDRVDGCPSSTEDRDGWEDEDGCPEPTLVRVRLQDGKGKSLPEAKGALLRVDGGDRIEFSGHIEASLEAGDWLLEASAEGRPDASRVVVVPAGPPILVEQQLSADVGRLIIVVRNELGALVDANVRIDDSRPQQAERGELRVDLAPGTHKIRAEADGYVAVMSAGKIVTGGSSHVEIVLPTSRARLRGERIEIDDKVYFELDRAVIQVQSHELLNQVAAVVVSHPELRRVRIEGHTDSRGDDAYNQRLSAQRADAVRTYLINAGVDPGRLQAVGHGESKPVDKAENEAAWEKNRRVEFVVAERAGDKR
jgi:outer membrane protein OmpA-like peptidoglycan-associated protein